MSDTTETNRRGSDLDGGGTPPPGDRESLAMWRKVAVGVVLAALAIGLVASVASRVGGQDDETSATEQRPSPTDVPGSTPRTTVSSQPPALVNTGDDPDWEAMVRSMLAYDAWLRRNPRPELLEAWMRPSSPLYAEGMETLHNLASGTWRYDPAPCEPLSSEIIRLNSRHGGSALVFVRFGPIPACRAVDRSGNVVLDRPAGPGNSVVWSLLQDGDGRWRFEKSERL